MKVFTLILELKSVKADPPLWLAGRAGVLLRETMQREERLSSWINAGCSRKIGDALLVFEIITPNAITCDAVLSAANRAIAEEFPMFKSLDYETKIFSIIPCKNQDQ